MRIALAQLDPTVGDVEGNADLLIDAVERAVDDGAHVLVSAELALVGYPPRDLLLRQGFVDDCGVALRRILDVAANADPELVLLIGTVRRDSEGQRPLRNSLAVCRGGRVEAWYDKRLLPGYDVFDEDRYFEPGHELGVIDVGDRRLGLLVCDDLWRAADVETECRYDQDPVAQTARAGADILIASNASPFVLGKFDRHRAQLRDLASRYGLPIVSVNQVGANDDLVFDGRSVVLDGDGRLVAQLPGFATAVQTVDVDEASPIATTPVDPMQELYDALVLGVRSYVRKTGHRRVLLGISGGIDSALTAVIASAALDARNVTGYFMPTRHSSAMSREDAATLARNLELGRFAEISIDEAYVSTRELLGGHGEHVVDVTDENIQARMRGLLLMALSNAGHGLLLAASNKSELATGYSTLYGDMCGALLVIGDVLKTQVVELARWVNHHARKLGFDGPPIPDRTITRPPSAELKPHQTDQDTLPPYDVLDEIVRRYVDHEQSVATIIEQSGLPAELVHEATRMIDGAQYKRHQAAIILKMSPRALGRGREMPIVMRQSGATCQVRPVGFTADARRGQEGGTQ